METIFIIDIGSNSVRLAKIENEKTIYKLTQITRLSENMDINNNLNNQSMDRTIKAVCKFNNIAQKENKQPLIFGTEALRKANNSNIFVNMIEKNCNVGLDIIDGEKEAYLGYIGAGGKEEDSSTVIDIGGASTEIISGEKENIKFSKSLKIGVVLLKEKCGKDKDKLNNYIQNKLKDIEFCKHKKCICIGGTACSIAAIDLNLKTYNSQKVNKHKINLKKLEKITDMLFLLTAKQITEKYCIDQKRAEVLVGGALLLLNIVKKLNCDEIVVSESDNIEGYAAIYKA